MLPVITKLCMAYVSAAICEGSVPEWTGSLPNPRFFEIFRDRDKGVDKMKEIKALQSREASLEAFSSRQRDPRMRDGGADPRSDPRTPRL